MHQAHGKHCISKAKIKDVKGIQSDVGYIGENMRLWVFALLPSEFLIFGFGLVRKDIHSSGDKDIDTFGGGDH